MLNWTRHLKTNCLRFGGFSGLTEQRGSTPESHRARANEPTLKTKENLRWSADLLSIRNEESCKRPDPDTFVGRNLKKTEEDIVR